MTTPFKLGLLCGGPSLERGISLNSARSVCDHVHSKSVEIVPIYFDYKKKAYHISRAQLYSNTPSDFDFKLKNSARPLNSTALIRLLKLVDLVFPAMHGPFGEDGGVQTLLEKHDIPYVGSSSAACKQAFDKFEANRFIREQGFYTIDCLLLTRTMRDMKTRIQKFFRSQKTTRFIVKPATGGSSIAVYSVGTVAQAVEAAETIFKQRLDARVVVEPFCQGTEFTVIILENKFGLPVSILPTEIELDKSDYNIFDYRKKYLATRHVTYHCPPRFPDEEIERIQIQAEQLFRLFGMRDFARFDGWVLPDRTLYFSDFNPISGMEQNSFLFMQSARIGMSHRDLLRFVIEHACSRYGIEFPKEQTDQNKAKSKKTVHVLFGGSTAERQVSLMSGTNVWLKLRRSEKYSPVPFLLDPKGQVWRLPYAFALNHTVEEILHMCLSAPQDETRLERLKRRVIERLVPKHTSEAWQLPEKMSLDEFFSSSEIVFLGLHGGIGEDGTLQKRLEKKGIAFNGPGVHASKACTNKFLTGQIISAANIKGVSVARKKAMTVAAFSRLDSRSWNVAWKSLVSELGSNSIIVKPMDDGCSAGVARLFDADDLRTYLHFAIQGELSIPPGSLSHQAGIVEMPTQRMRHILFEEFISTDKVQTIGNKLAWEDKTGWIEVTIGVLEENGRLRALNPSITVASGNVLSLEEKFQGGTGVNITPPPAPFVSTLAVAKAKQRLEKVAHCLGIEGYSRIDCFLHRQSGDLIIIEANTLPGLTPATVIYHQALLEKPALYPTQFLEKVVDHALWRRSKKGRKVHLPKIIGL